jgi:RES domain
MALLCPECFDNRTLKRRLEEIRPKVGRGRCDNHPTRKGIPVTSICEVVDEVFRNNFIRSDDSELSEGEPLADVLSWFTDAESEDVAQTLASCLIDEDDPDVRHGEEVFYADDFKYEEAKITDHLHVALWQDFRQSIVHGRRFFNSDAHKLLAEIFRNIHLQRDIQRNPPVYMLVPNKAGSIYRARIVTDADLEEISKDPVGGLGPAPLLKGKAGRMNVSGIPAFYGSFDLETCAAELRPPVGGNIVSARFRLARPLCVLDMTRYRKRPTLLDPFAKDHVRRLTQWRFMQRFRREMSKPILKTDEHIDYVPTQAVAEYLNAIHQVRIGSEKVHIDAIIFNSAQRPAGRNIVVLGGAAFIEPIEGKKKRTSTGLVAPSLDLFLQERRQAPGLKIIGNSIKVSTVSKAEIGLGTPEAIDDYLNPPF